ncbi:MAG TPA: FAD-binding oxidoreductase [Pseudomonadota bacterium]|jgi:FAD/FMN-containing dehydrogenase|nr:FAD-binding oxidoreductase [Pseudomonadota bacterium]
MTGRTRIVGWGGVGTIGEERLAEELAKASESVPLLRGLGRSYGDSAVPPPSQPTVLTTVLADRILSFDPETGLLCAEAGLSLAELNRLFLPRRFFVPVTPGTQFVTLGGMVASDVHGKNHHVEGAFGDHVEKLRIRVGSGSIVDCSPAENSDLFEATIGGMGLTGHILEVTFRMCPIPSQWIYQESEQVTDLDAMLNALDDAARHFPMTVAWIDCLTEGKAMGRGILYRGRWATTEEAPAQAPSPKLRLFVPFQFPSWAMSAQVVRLFNSAIYHSHVPRVKKGLVSPEAFFYPLDTIRDWNRIYGSRGFTQHQAVLPASAGRGAVRRFLELLTSLKGASFLCVLKDCGKQGRGMLSFPMPGTSIALDLALREHTQEHIDRLNELVIREGGRIYLTKDALTRPEHFAKMEPRLAAFRSVRDKWDPAHRVRSAQSVRLFGDKP